MNDEKSVRIIRTKHDKEHPFMMLARVTAQNTGVSYEALGVLVYLLSKPDDWKTRLTDLQKRKHGKKPAYGRDAIASIMRELTAAGYITLQRTRNESGHRLTGSEYVISETLDYREPEIQTPGKTPPIHNTESSQDTEKEHFANANKPRKVKPPAISQELMNPMKDALVAAFGWNWQHMTKAECGVIQATAKELCTVGIAPERVVSLYAWCKAKYRDFSPRALATHQAEWRKSHLTDTAKDSQTPAAPEDDGWHVVELDDPLPSLKPTGEAPF